MYQFQLHSIWLCCENGPPDVKPIHIQCSSVRYDKSFMRSVRIPITNFILNLGKNPPPLCIPIPQLPILSLCIRLTDIHTDEDQNLYACLSMELQLQGISLIIFNFDCARFGPNGITLVKPSPRPPLENGQIDMGLSLANLEQTLKGNITSTTAKPGGLPNLFEFNFLTIQNGENATSKTHP